MSKTNHRDGTTKKRHQYGGSRMAGTGAASPMVECDKTVGANWGGDNANGSQGYARNKAGGKKFVRSRLRFHEKATVRKLTDEA